MDNDDVLFTFFVPRRPIDGTWLRDLLQRLWARGLQLRALTSEAATWDGQLRSTQQVVEGVTANSPLPTLEEELEVVGDKEMGWMELWDHQVYSDLEVDPNLVYAATREDDPHALDSRAYGTVKLQIDGRYLSRQVQLPATLEAFPTAFLLPQYHVVTLAMTHWAQVLCAELAPVYAVGSVVGRTTRDDDVWLSEADTAIDRALQQGQLPDLSPWLTEEIMVYASPTLMSQERLGAWLATPERAVQRLPQTGGYFATAPVQPHEVAFAEEHERLARAALDLGDRARARAHLDRALGVYDTIGMADTNVSKRLRSWRTQL